MTQDFCDPRASPSLLSRKVHKADREKLRRDKLNEQFAELAAVLDPEKPKQDKASILGDSLQVVQSLRVEIKRLRIERGTLFDESRDLKRERDDLEEEKTALKKQTDELDVQVEQLLKSARPFKHPALPGLVPPFPTAAPHYAPAFQLGSEIDTSSSNNPFVYLTSSNYRVERPSVRYPVADFLSKVHTNHGLQSLGSSGSRQNEQFMHEKECCRGGESDIHLHLGQPRMTNPDDIDTDLHLQLSSTISDASSSGAKDASLCPS